MDQATADQMVQYQMQTAQYVADAGAVLRSQTAFLAVQQDILIFIALTVLIFLMRIAWIQSVQRPARGGE